MFHAITQCGAQTLGVGHMFAGDSEVEEVIGWTNGDPFGAGDEDYKGIGGHIRYANGVECFVYSRESAAKGLIVTGSKGVFVTDKRNGRFYKSVEGAGRDVLWGLGHDESKTFKPYRGHSEGGYDEEGWLYPGDRLMDSMRSIVDAIEKGVEPRASGTIQHRSLEVAMAMRESARRGSVPVKLPLEDRSVTLMPQRYRWDNKKLLHGEEWYAEADRSRDEGVRTSPVGHIGGITLEGNHRGGRIGPRRSGVRRIHRRGRGDRGGRGVGSWDVGRSLVR